MHGGQEIAAAGAAPSRLLHLKLNASSPKYHSVLGNDERLSPIPLNEAKKEVS